MKNLKATKNTSYILFTHSAEAENLKTLQTVLAQETLNGKNSSELHLMLCIMGNDCPTLE